MLRPVTRVLAVGTALAVSALLTTPARAETVVYRASDDARVEQGQPSTNFGTSPLMGADSSPVVRSFLRFDVGPLSGDVTRAGLRLWVTDKSTNGPELWKAVSFDEGSVTWSSQPATSGQIADLGSVSAGQWVELDVRSVVTGPGTYAFALLPDSSDGTDFSTDEAASNRPELVLETAGTTTTTGATTTTTDESTTTTTAPPGGTSGRWVAADDALVMESEPTTNFGALGEVRADTSPMTDGLVLFRTSSLSGSVRRAVLRLFVTNGSSDGPELWRAQSFDEDTVTWANAPAATSRVTDLGSVSSGWLEIDVRSAVGTSAATYSFALLPDSTDGLTFVSGEGSSNRPELVIEAGELPPPPSGEAFDVGLLGDTGYSSESEQGLLRSRSDMNGFDLAFATHDGDIWGGSKGSCSESDYRRVRDVFNGFETAFVYTPGDNEWKDCPEGSSSRLSLVREIFFPSSQTLGRNPMSVTRQSGRPENARWTKNGIVFATINEPGSSGSSGSMQDQNVAWLNAAFDLAEDLSAPGVMVIWQDNPFRPSGANLYRTLKDRATAFDLPVVLVHGDTHSQQIDHPWSDVPNFTRVETFGPSSSGNWIRATVDPEEPDVFSFSIERP